MTRSTHYRSVFISDVHLGTPDCQAELLLEFLTSMDCDYLYLVGDIFDVWKLKQSVHWPDVKNQILSVVFDKAKAGTRVVYVPGNHDELMQDFVGNIINNVELKAECIHTTATGKQLLVLHGDQFDALIRNMDWLEALGDNLYGFIMYLSRVFNRGRSMLGYPYWSLAAFIKLQFKEARRYIEKYENTVTEEAHQRGFDGIVCGHIHHPNIIDQDQVTYFNTGDWVEHCTALVEGANGEMQLLHWLAERESRFLPESVAA